MRVPVEVLVVVCLVVGLMPALIIGPLLAIGAQAALFGGSYGRCRRTSWRSGTA